MWRTRQLVRAQTPRSVVGGCVRAGGRCAVHGGVRAVHSTAPHALWNPHLATRSWNKEPMSRSEPPPVPHVSTSSSVNDWRACVQWHTEEFGLGVQAAKEAAAAREAHGEPPAPFLLGGASRRLHRSIAVQANALIQLWNNIQAANGLALTKARAAAAAAGPGQPAPLSSGGSSSGELSRRNLAGDVELLDPVTFADLLHAASQLVPFCAVPPAGMRPILPSAAREQNEERAPLDYSAYVTEWTSLFSLLPRLPSFLADMRKELMVYFPQALTHLTHLAQLEADVVHNFEQGAPAASASAATTHSLDNASPSSDPAAASPSSASLASSPSAPSPSAPSALSNPLWSAESANSTAVARLMSKLGAGASNGPRDFVNADGHLPFRPVAHYGYQYTRMCQLAIRIATRLHDVELAFFAYRTLRRINEILLLEEPRLHYLLRTWDDQPPHKPAPHAYPRTSALERVAQSPVPARAIRQLLFEATRQKNLTLQALHDATRLLQVDCMDVPASNSDASDARHALLRGAVHVRLRFCNRKLAMYWEDVTRFKLPLSMRQYALFASTASSLQFEIMRELDQRKLHAHRPPAPHDLLPPYGATTDPSFAGHAHYPVPKTPMPVCDPSGQYSAHEWWQIVVLQRFPVYGPAHEAAASRRQPETLEARVAQLRTTTVQTMVDSLTQLLVEAKARLEQQLRHQLDAPEESAELGAARQAQDQVVYEMALMRRPELTPIMRRAADDEREEASSTGAASSQHADEHSSFTPAEAEYRAMGLRPARRLHQSSWVLPDEAHNSMLVLRFLKPLFMACARSGRTDEALASLQLFIQCSLLPPFGFMRLAMLMLRHEVREARLSLSMYDMAHVLPDHARLRGVLRWALMIQAHWPLHNEVYAFLLAFHADLASWARQAEHMREQALLVHSAATSSKPVRAGGLVASPSAVNMDLLRPPWNAKELHQLRTEADTALQELLAIGFASTFYHRADARVEPAQRVLPWQAAAVAARIDLMRANPLPCGPSDQAIAEAAAASHAAVAPRNEATWSGASSLVAPSSPNKALADEWLQRMFGPDPRVGDLLAWSTANLSKDGRLDGWHASGWILQAHRVLVPAVEQVLLHERDGLDLFAHTQRLLAQHVELAPHVYEYAIERLVADWEVCVEEARHARELRELRDMGMAAGHELDLLEDRPRASPGQYVSSVAWLLLTMLDYNLVPPMAHLEWAASQLAVQHTLAASFYMHALRHRLQHLCVSPSPALFEAFLLAECEKASLREALALRPQETALAPTAFLRAAVPAPPPPPKHHHPHLLHQYEPPLRRKESGLEAALLKVSGQWNEALEQSGLLKASSFTAPSPAAAEQAPFSMTPSPMAPMGHLSPPSALARLRASAFHSWLHGVLTLSLEGVLATLDSMKAHGLTPSLRAFALALEACMQLLKGHAGGTRSSLAASKAGSVLAALTNHPVGSHASAATVAKAMHYALLLQSELRACGLHTNAEVANLLLALFLRGGRHLHVHQALCGDPSSEIGFTFAGGAVRRVAYPNSQGQMQVVMSAPLSLEAEVALLERVAAQLATSPPEHEKRPEGDTDEELIDLDTLVAAVHAKTQLDGLALYVRPDRATLAILDSWAASSEASEAFPSVKAFHSLLARRRSLEKQVRESEQRWLAVSLREAVESDAPMAPERTWKRQAPPAAHLAPSKQKRAHAHVAEGSEPSPVCQHYLLGRCTFGPACSLQHLPPGIPQVTRKVLGHRIYSEVHKTTPPQSKRDTTWRWNQPAKDKRRKGNKAAHAAATDAPSSPRSSDK